MSFIFDVIPTYIFGTEIVVWGYFGFCRPTKGIMQSTTLELGVQLKILPFPRRNSTNVKLKWYSRIENTTYSGTLRDPPKQ